MKKIMSLLGLLALLLVVAPAVGSSKKYEAPKRAEAKVIMDMDDVTEGTEGKEEKKIEQQVGEVKQAADVKASDEIEEESAKELNKRGVSLWEKDPVQAVKLYRAAAARGCAAAMYNLGVFLQRGGGTEKDKKQAVEWYQKAANLGDVNAMYNLGVCLRDGIGVDQKDEKQAFEWLQKAANLGDDNAMTNVGSFLQQGIGVDQKDEKQAVVWYQKAAKLGNVHAMYNMGVCLQQGVGVREDDKAAVDWYEKAANKGYPGAMHAFGICLLDGKGIEVNVLAAAHWLYMAADQGYVAAHVVLGRSLLTGQYRFVIDLRMAVAHFEYAAQKNNYQGLLFLGYCCQKGLGIALDTKKAEALFNRAGQLAQKAAVDVWREQSNADRLGLVDGQPFSCFNKECSICNNNLVPGQAILRFDCCHGFHTKCIEPWLDGHDTCPSCRGNATNRLRGIAF